MTGIIIFTAGREDAYRDYQRSVKSGHTFEELEPHLSEVELERLTETYEGDTAHVWGTSVQSKWDGVKPGDIALVYRRGKYIAQGRVVLTTHNYELAEALWDTEGNPWDDSNPWEYLTFLTDIEDIEVEAEDFNELVDYEESYIPQGFTRVADYRIQNLVDQFESVETAITNLTGVGSRVHEVEDKSEDEDEDQIALNERLVVASEDGDRAEEFERLVAKAFTQIGCEAKWIEGGGDTDVEITDPGHLIIDAKARSSRGVNNINFTRIESHKKQRGADHAVVVASHFAPSVIEDATVREITCLTAERLSSLLDLHDQYAVPPERVVELLLEPGAFQDDRMDQLREMINARKDATKGLLDVIKALDHADEEIASPSDLRWILIGMDDPENAPEDAFIEASLTYLAHPSLGLVDTGENGYQLCTNYENAVKVLESSRELIREVCHREG